MREKFSPFFTLILCGSLMVAAQNTPSVDVIEAKDITLDSAVASVGMNPSSPPQIRKRIASLAGTTFKKWCADAGISGTPSTILLRTFKLEKECELWAGPGDKPLKLVKILRICSVDDAPGPKLIQGDGKTPEGFYESVELFGSPYWWMWMKLSPQSIDAQGEPGNGSSFRLCIDYPNPSDRARTKRLSGKNPGGGICIHGNCVTAGCISFENRVFLMIYYFASLHNERRSGHLQVHIFPFRFSEDVKKEYSGSYRAMESGELLKFWNTIEQGYALFEKTHRPLRFSYRQDSYVFK